MTPYSHYIPVRYKQAIDEPMQHSTKALEEASKGLTPSGQFAAGVGGGGLGALLGAGVGAFTAPEGQMLRRALLGAGIGGAAGGLGGYFASPHIKPFNITYDDTDTAPLGGMGGDIPGLRGERKTRPISVAEILGALTNLNVMKDLAKG